MGRKLIDRKGEIKITKEGYKIIITRYDSNKNIDIMFLDKYKHVIKNTRYDAFKNGTIKNPYHKSIFGIG